LKKRKKEAAGDSSLSVEEIASAESMYNSRLRQRHSGIIGLSAFVNAYPYDVPEFVPDVLMVLSDHLHDPQPIPVRFESPHSSHKVASKTLR
jgi:hypothetical protein